MRRAVVLTVLALAAGLAVAAVVAGAQALRFAASAETADGRVVAIDVRQSGGARSEVSYFPVVAFTPARGERPVRFAGAAGGGREYQVGDRVSVLFRADDPRDARLGSLAAVWGTPAGLAFSAMLALGSGLLLRRVLLEEQPGGPDPDDPDDP